MKRIILLTLILSLILSSLPFVGFAKNTNENQILSVLSSLSIMNGDENGDFCLDNLVARSEFTKMAVASSKYRNSVSSVSRTSPFHDVPYTYWGASYIKAALNAKFISGYPDSTFRPENPVTLEEGVTIVLKLLGYTDEDFSNTVWPFGEMATATDLELLNNVDKVLGENLQRRDVMNLFYNALGVNVKGSSSDLLTSFGYTYNDDVLFIASANEDSSIATDKILTSIGQFKVTDGFDFSNAGYKGDLILKNSDTAVAFVPSNVKSGEYTLNAIVGDDLLVYDGSGTVSLEVGENTDVYYKSQKVTLESASSLVSLGDSVSVFKNKNGDVDYALIGTKALKGPYTVLQDVSYYGVPQSAVVYIDGEKATLSSVDTHDILYYSEEINTAWVYTKKITGVYVGATPSKDSPTTVNISGTDYGFETADAYKMFATGGEYNIGDTVTILLGRNNKIAGVKASSESSAITGYVTQTGNKTFEKANKDTYTSYYVGVVLSDGTYQEFETKKNYEDLKASVVKITLKDGIASVTRLTQSKITGTVDAENNKIGTKTFASNCKFIEILSTDVSQPAVYNITYKSRLDGVELTGKSVIYYTQNKNGEIDSVFLNDVTGDGYKYGLVTEVNGYSYTVACSGGSYISNGKKYTSIDRGSVVKILVSGNNILSMTALDKIDEKITEIDEYTATTSSQSYKVYEDVVAFERINIGQWQIIPYSDATEHNISAYYDSKASKIRVIVVN